MKMKTTDETYLRRWYEIYRVTGSQEALDHVGHKIWDVVCDKTKHLRTEKLQKKRRVIMALDILEELRHEYELREPL
jgi:hypothetical protein